MLDLKLISQLPLQSYISNFFTSILLPPPPPFFFLLFFSSSPQSSLHLLTPIVCSTDKRKVV
ncbi:unnamed protein product [Meloidogyne enterolobii]|uniref:Uncharacterized protein n=1 Tax=Meloidogyne enterolobii TaxID=390850 RepID=A0ACB0YSH1_MELEN